MAKAQVEKVTGTVEQIIDVRLEVFAGFTSDESVDAIKNASMRKKVKEFRKAVESEVQSKWKQAMAIGSMTIDMRKEFGCDKNVAEFLGMSKGNFSKMQRAGKVALEAKEKGIELPAYDKFIELLCVENDKHGNQNLLECAKYVNENEMTREEIRDYVRCLEVEEKKQAGNTENENEQEERESSFASENEQEERWENVLRVVDTEIDGMDGEIYKRFLDALYDVCAEFGLNMDNVWAGRN